MDTCRECWLLVACLLRPRATQRPLPHWARPDYYQYYRPDYYYYYHNYHHDWYLCLSSFIIIEHNLRVRAAQKPPLHWVRPDYCWYHHYWYLYWCRFFRLKKAIFPAKWSTFACSMSYIFHSESLYVVQWSIWATLNQFEYILRGVRILLAYCTYIFTTSKTLS